MTLSDVANFATVLSGLAVLASLVYLSLQIRQNTLAHRATAHQGRRAFARDQILLAADPAVAALILRGHANDKTMTEVERYQYQSIVTSFFVGMDELFWLHEQGILDQHSFETQALVLGGYLRNPGGRIVWQIWKSRASLPFRAYVEQHMPAFLREPTTSFDRRWKAAEVAAAAQESASVDLAP